MFLIYIIGGIIPFVIATFYISQQSRNLILEQNKKAQQEEVALIGSSIEESMEVATDVGEQPRASASASAWATASSGVRLAVPVCSSI